MRTATGIVVHCPLNMTAYTITLSIEHDSIHDPRPPVQKCVQTMDGSRNPLDSYAEGCVGQCCVGARRGKLCTCRAYTCTGTTCKMATSAGRPVHSCKDKCLVVRPIHRTREISYFSIRKWL